MNTIKYNSKVIINYTLKGNGVIFETTFDKSPIEIIIGKCNLPQIIEASLYNMVSGERKEYKFDSKEIFGIFDEKKISKTSLNSFKNNKNIKPGDIIETVIEDKSYFITILEILNDEVIIDMNHPLCNKDIIFDVEVLEIFNDS
jgi:FKBP-type peptidyl-prolyl cis-trans isomerase 2